MSLRYATAHAAFIALATLSYAGLRAKNDDSLLRDIMFLAGLPATVVPYIFVEEGSGNVFGWQAFPP
ncbi:MAG: hypothetical protein ACYCOU_01395 [Sulfobacillus sp.]